MPLARVSVLLLALSQQLLPVNLAACILLLLPAPRFVEFGHLFFGVEVGGLGVRLLCALREEVQLLCRRDIRISFDECRQEESPRCLCLLLAALGRPLVVVLQHVLLARKAVGTDLPVFGGVIHSGLLLVFELLVQRRLLPNSDVLELVGTFGQLRIVPNDGFVGEREHDILALVYLTKGLHVVRNPQPREFVFSGHLGRLGPCASLLLLGHRCCCCCFGGLLLLHGRLFLSHLGHPVGGVAALLAGQYLT
mmetsp:Transcript_47185/g.117713  ORF Transcript_47185/g.117713 Transcript_47185/m.117713 type:complete len:251 (+) Transcript_47185:1762-2514(+)